MANTGAVLEVEHMSAELAAELAANNTRRLVDPKSTPARFHHLRGAAISPAHGFAAFQDYGRDSLALRIGKGTHGALFGPAPVPLPTHIKQRRGKAYDVWKVKQPTEATILSRKEYERAQRVADAIRSHEVASNVLFGPGTIREGRILWTQNGRSRQSTPDARGPHHLAELKTCRCSEPAKFIRDATYRSYHVQLADQALAIQADTGKWPEEVYIVAVESVPPHAVTVFQVSDATMRKGRRLAELWLAALLDCELRGSWTRAYSDKVELFDIIDDNIDLADDVGADDPEWMKPDFDDD